VGTLAKACADDSKVSNQVTLTGMGVRIQSSREVFQPFKGFVEEPLPFPFRPAGSRGARSVLRLQDGWLVGFSNGEYGGSLWFVDSVDNKPTQLLDDNVSKIARLLGNVYVFTNTFGKGFSGGEIVEVGENGKIENRAGFFGAPLEFVQESSDSFLMVGNGGVFRVSSNLHTQQQLSKTELFLFAPDSMVIGADKTIFVGLKFFALRLIPTENLYREQWLVPSACMQFHVDPEKRDCVCDGP
jgi:hypothetical protein